MWIFPVFLDVRPPFLPRGRVGTLLLAPLGEGSVLDQLRARVRAVTGAAPVVVTTFPVDPDYERAIREACPDIEAVETLPAFVERCYSYQPSDRLLLVDPSCFPLEADDPALSRLGETDDPRTVKHLVALARSDVGTREYVDADGSGRIRTIQRYYDAVTWPLATGVACTLVPVVCLRVSYELPLASLTRLRRLLAAEGVPSRDVALAHGAAHLSTEQGLLAMNERAVRALARSVPGPEGPGPLQNVAGDARVHGSVNLVGPVVVQRGAEICQGVTIIGPSVIGRGSVVEAGATIAQSVVGAGQVVPAGATLRHRVFFGDPTGARPADEGQPAGDDPSVEGIDEGSWETPPFDLAGDSPQSAGYLVFKRAMDATAAALGILLLSPLGLLIAALIKLESRGPVHFGHPREGMDGRQFNCWKFRTMFQDADVQQRKLAQQNQVDGPQFKINRDPRRTRLGRILSATSLDELPQLWNVLAGEMSLVGPRPSPFRENQYCVPWREGRLSVRPGITGLWQVCRHDRHKADFHQWIYYDLLYVRNLSFWLDVRILALTFASLAKGGAIPLSWLLPPEKYGERRSTARTATPPPVASIEAGTSRAK